MGVVRSFAHRWTPALGLFIFLSCATDLVPIDGGYRHTRHGYRFQHPPSTWKRVEVTGAAIAYRFSGGPAERASRRDTMTLRSGCGEVTGDLAIMARLLRIGLGPHSVQLSEPVSVDGRAGWVQVFEAQRGGKSIHLKTVTAVARDCSFDWTLATTGPLSEVEPDFDAWWQSFELPAPSRGEVPVAVPADGGAV